MKRLALFGTLILVMIFLTSGMSGVENEGRPGNNRAKILRLSLKEKHQKIFRIYNPTDEPVRINSITTTGECNCSVPIWTTGRIKPGKFGKVMVVFNRELQGDMEIPLQIYFYNKEDIVDESLTQRITLSVAIGEKGK